jgi:hypothetical protein
MLVTVGGWRGKDPEVRLRSTQNQRHTGEVDANTEWSTPDKFSAVNLVSPQMCM